MSSSSQVTVAIPESSRSHVRHLPGFLETSRFDRIPGEGKPIAEAADQSRLWYYGHFEDEIVVLRRFRQLGEDFEKLWSSTALRAKVWANI